jgi:hypothetical protein
MLRVMVELVELVMIGRDPRLKDPVGVCGVYCGFCPTFRLDRNRCFGCNWVSEQLRKTRETHRGCIFWECAKNKKVESCFLCKEFPCKTHYDSNEAVYTRQALDMWKELKETGFDFEETEE